MLCHMVLINICKFFNSNINFTFSNVVMLINLYYRAVMKIRLSMMIYAFISLGLKWTSYISE